VIHGTDLSSHQGAPQFPAVKAAGLDFVVLTATEGVGFVDRQCTSSRARAHAAGLVVGLYHFARAGDPGAEADFFTGTVGGLVAGEFAVLDWEVAAADPAGWCTAWLAAVRSRLGVPPLVYLNRSTVQGSDWSPVVRAGAALWLACYDDSTDAVASGSWPGLAMKQYSDQGSVPGIAGPVDLDVFYGSVEQLLAHGPRG
jgi:GH25 family lysozyme M1 (1,4-beta-N-acetylmuramidase)